MPIEVALVEPDIAGNAGTLLRTAACFGAHVHIVEPCGFAFGDRALRRAGMDYAERLAPTRHSNRAQFLNAMHAAGRRLLLLTTQADAILWTHSFLPGDVLMLGSEGSGAPPDIHAAAHVRLAIPMVAGFRSLNVAVAGGIALAQAARQMGVPQSAPILAGDAK